MSKKLKLAVLSPKVLRSGRVLVANPSEKESPYFADEGKRLRTKTDPKKRLPIKIEYEATEDETDNKSVAIATSSDVKSENAEKMKNGRDAEVEERNEERSMDSRNVKNEERWIPPGWETVLNNIREMRKHGTAPVDEMGCHKCVDPNASAPVSRFQSLVALMLSSQTKDQVTYAAMQRLKAHGCKPDLIAATPDDVLGKLIYPVGFWKV